MFTLREIAYAFAAFAGADPEKMHARARMLRDKGLIVSSVGASQGATTGFPPGDALHALWALSASTGGAGHGQIAAVNTEIHAPFSGQPGKLAFHGLVEPVLGGDQSFVCLDIITRPWAATEASITGSHTAPLSDGVTARLIWPLAPLAEPLRKLMGH